MRENRAKHTESAESHEGKHWRNAMRNVLYMGSAFAMLAAPSIAAAQEADIVVTGQRRAQLLEDVPASVIAINPEQLQEAGISNMHEIGQLTPGVQVNFAGAFTQPAIRGVSTVTNGNGVENNVALYVDGFYEPSNIIVNMDLANLQSIEILKGPQGTLYGRNATGGAMLLNTLRPSDTFTGNIQATYASFEDRRLSGYISGPISDRARFGVSAYWRDMNGYLDYSTPGPGFVAPDDAVPVEQRSARARLEIDVTDSLVATLGYNYLYNDDARSNFFTPYEHLSLANRALPPGARATSRDEVSANSPNDLPMEINQLQLTLDWDLNIGRLTSRTGYAENYSSLNFDTDGTYVNGTNSLIDFEELTFQQGLDLEIDTIDRFNLLLGIFYYNDDTASEPGRHISTYSAGVLGSRSEVSLETQAIAAYADATIEFTDRIEVTLGGRYSSEEKNAYQVVRTAAGVPLGSNPPTNRSETFDNFTPRASIRYEIDESTNVYANYSRGFRSGTFSTSPTAPALWAPLDPEIIDGYEIGFKTAQDRFRFDIAAFYYDYTDLHVSSTQPNPASPGLFLTVFQNADSAESYGVDALLEWNPIDNLRFRLGGAWLNAEYVRFTNATGTPLNATTDTNITTAPATIQNWSGQQLFRSPEWSANLGIVYDIALGGAGELQLSTNVAYTDSYVVNNGSLFGPLGPAGQANQQRYRQDAFTLINANVKWTSPSEAYSISVFGNNLTDEEYLLVHTGGAGGDRGNFAMPINYGVRVGYGF